MQVIKRHFQDLSYVQINGEDPRQQQLVVHTDSKDDRELLMVNIVFPLGGDVLDMVPVDVKFLNSLQI